MLEIPCYDKEGNRKESVRVEEDLFGKIVKERLLREVIVKYEANRRQGTASTKTRGQVEGSTKKPWRQKHTGRARAGTIRSPIWRHGGVIFGPHPRDYSLVIPKKVRRAALDSALLSKFIDNEALIVEGFDFSEPKTKKMAALLKKIGIQRSCLVGVAKPDTILFKSTRNIPRVDLQAVDHFNAYEVLKHRNLVLTKEAFDRLVDRRKSSAGEDAVKQEAGKSA
jgi:large subunit ribosomal protein L4